MLFGKDIYIFNKVLIYTYIYIHIYICMYVLMYMCVCVCVYVLCTASLAVQAGVDSIIVSNHGARQLDYVFPSILALEEVLSFMSHICVFLFLYVQSFVLVEGGHVSLTPGLCLTRQRHMIIYH